MAETTIDPIDINLELFTEPQRRMFKVDGAPFYLRNFDELNVVEQFEFQETLKSLQQRPQTLDEHKDWQATLRGLFDQVVVGTALQDRLTDDHKMKVVQAFLTAGRTNTPVPPSTENTSERHDS